MFRGADLGTYPGEKCTFCGEVFTASRFVGKMESIAKKKGVWGLGRKTKVSRSGNSLAVRIPKEIVKFLNIHEGQDAYIHPEKKRIVIEPA